MMKILVLLKLVLVVMKRAIRLPYSFLLFLFSPFLYLLHYHSRTGNGLFRVNMFGTRLFDISVGGF